MHSPSLQALRHLLLAWALTLGALPALAAGEPGPSPEALRLQRLRGLAELWGEVRYRHPTLAWKELEDPAPHVEPWDILSAGARPAPSPRPLHGWEPGEVLLVNLAVVSAPGGLSPFTSSYGPLVEDLRKARAVVVDLRAWALTDPMAPWRRVSALELLAPELFQGELRTPAQRRVRRAGYRSQFGIPSGYTVEFVEGTEDLTAQVRVAEFTVPVRADVRVPERPATDTADAPLQAALQLARQGWKAPARAPRPEPLPRALWRPDKRYEEPPYPARALRQLAAIHFWNVIRLFHPTLRFQYHAPVPRSDVAPYRGPVVTLIDERTLSQAESTGLVLEAVSGTTFVGSPSAGANGDITDFSLPGGITVLFSGAEVRHADGRRLQGLGLQPRVRVRPTLEGLRAGRDEVLEAALRQLEKVP